MNSNSEFQKLIDFFQEFPGVGTRQAKRFAVFLLTKNKFQLQEFIEALQNSKDASKQCGLCMRYHFGLLSSCSVCSDTARDSTKILIVEKEQDIESFESTHLYNGMYFVIGKLLSLISKEEVKLLRIEKLLERISTSKNLSEIILALPTTPNGNFTDAYIRQEIHKISTEIKTKSLGRGFATGSDPEYADKETIIYALQNRI